MASTYHYNFSQLPAAPVDWISIINDMQNKIEVGRTIKVEGGETDGSAQYKGFYINSNGEAWICDGGEYPIGLWQSSGMTDGTDGFGQIEGIMINGSWTWNEGVLLYLNTSGVLTENSGNTRPVAYTISATTIMLIPPTNIPSTDGLYTKQVFRSTYDFSEHGGAVSTIGLGVYLPNNAIITQAWYEVLTTLTSSGDAATIALGIPTDDASGILAAIAINDGTNPWDAGFHDCDPDGTATNATTKTTDIREISATIAVEAVTAGKFIVFGDYIVSD